MKNDSKTFENNLLDKFLFKISALLLVSIMSGIIILVVGINLNDNLNFFYLILNAAFIALFFLILANKLNVQLEHVGGAAIILLIAYSMLGRFYTNPFVESRYIGFETYIGEYESTPSDYCYGGCSVTKKLLNSDKFAFSHEFYSWRIAEANGYNIITKDCCNLKPMDIKYLYGLLFVFEWVFYILPAILTIATLFFILEYTNRKEYTFFTTDFMVSQDEKLDIRKINLICLTLLIVIIIYNLKFMAKL